MSANGRYVGYRCGHEEHGSVYLYDRETDKTTGLGGYFLGGISADGRYATLNDGYQCPAAMNSFKSFPVFIDVVTGKRLVIIEIPCDRSRSLSDFSVPTRTIW